MGSKKNLILKYVGLFIVMISFGALMSLLELGMGRLIIEFVIVDALIFGISFMYDFVSWQQVNGAIYPIYKKEGFSPHFFEVAEEYGASLENELTRTRFYLVLESYYMEMEQYDKALITFTKIDANYVHSIEQSIGLIKRGTVSIFYNNGLYICLKTGHLEDAKRIYQDGRPFLQRREYSKAVLDTLAEYHYQIGEYEKAVFYDEKLIAKGELATGLVQAATKRLEVGRKHLAGVQEQEIERGN